jgi:phosphoserine aminotransferase
MLAIEDFIDALNWARSIGGISALSLRVQKNYRTVKKWASRSKFFEFLVEDESIRAKNVNCLKIRRTALGVQEQWSLIKSMAEFLEAEAGIYDVVGHIDSFYPNVRIWSGPTVEQSDLEFALPWLDFAFSEVSS